MASNLDLVRTIYAERERGDFSSSEWAHPEIEFVIADGPEPISVKGLLAAQARFREAISAFEDYRSEVQEYRELDDERILVISRATARGKSSGVEVTQRRANIFHIQDGRVTRFVSYWDSERAMADLGLTPETG